MPGTNLRFIKINIKNAANVVLHTAIKKVACSLSFLLFNWEKFKARRGVLSLCYLTKNFSYFELLLQYLFKKRRVP